jgi:magnesium transporter
MFAVVNSLAYAGGRRVAEVPIEGIGEALVHPDRFIWIGLHEPDDKLLRQIQEEFKLHELAIEDALRAHQRPKVERYGDSLFVVLRTVQRSSGERKIEFGETHLFVGNRYLVSVRHGSSLSYVDVRARCEATPELLAKGSGFALYALMDFVVDQYFPIVEVLEDELEALEDEIFARPSSRETTMRIYRLHRDLLEVKRAVSPLVDVSNRLMRAEMLLISEDVRPYFRDVHDHVLRINERVDGLLALLRGALEANLSLTTIGQNEAVKRLAGWAAIVAVPTMVFSVYGMNFDVMPELRWSWGYPAVIGVTAGLCSILYVKFKRAGWL